MIILVILLALGLGLLGYLYHRLLVRCLLAEQKIRSQEELESSFDQLSKQAYLEAQGKASETLSKLEAQLRSLENERKADHGSMKQQLKSLVEAELQLKSETSKLSRALRSPAGRGRWGRSSSAGSWNWPA